MDIIRFSINNPVKVSVGVILIVTGYQEYNTFGSRMGRAFGSTPSNRVLFMFIFGGICSLLGFLKIFKK